MHQLRSFELTLIACYLGLLRSCSGSSDFSVEPGNPSVAAAAFPSSLDNDAEASGTAEDADLAAGLYAQERAASVRGASARMVEVCAVNRTGTQQCVTHKDDPAVAGDFFVPNLAPGEIFPIVWRSDHKRVTKFAFQIGVPPELTEVLSQYADRLGVTDLMRKYTSSDPIPAMNIKNAQFVELSDGNDWLAQRPAKKWQSNMHWIGPADEATHEEYLKILALGNFDQVLHSIGTSLGLKGLAVYQMTFIGVSHSTEGFMHFDSRETGGSVYNVIVPLILDEEATPELKMTEWDAGSDLADDGEYRQGSLKYKVGTAVMLGDDAEHGTEACDYRAAGVHRAQGMRLAATIYIADINSKNSMNITQRTLTQMFPMPNLAWLEAQAGRHWVADSNADGVERRSLVNDKGRKHFSFRDSLSHCPALASAGQCLDTKTRGIRSKCLTSCKIYESNWNDEDDEGHKVIVGFT